MSPCRHWPVGLLCENVYGVYVLASGAAGLGGPAMLCSWAGSALPGLQPWLEGAGSPAASALTLPEYCQLGLITFGMHVHVHELGFQEFSKAIVFQVGSTC